MDLPVNARAEGRVLVPWEHRKYPNMTLQDSSRKFSCLVRSTLTTGDNRWNRSHDRRRIRFGLARNR